ncbi:MAG: ferrous iron transport protein B [Nitrospirota bacterium]|nr:ferrous iron transport protein B [Nitrospirota bacterium]
MDCHDKSQIGKESGKSGDESFPRAALAGNPNVGKSVIFGLLTGKYVTVSNYPGTSVEVTRGTAKLPGGNMTLLDTPGVNSFTPMSEDERVTRDILLKERFDAIVQVGDAKNLKRVLMLTVQLAEMGNPFFLVLNMGDEAASRGITIDYEKLAGVFGVEVVPAIATQKKGIDRISKAIRNPMKSAFSLRYNEHIERGIASMEPLLPESGISKRSLALMLLAGDNSLVSWLNSEVGLDVVKKIELIRQEVDDHFSESLGYVISHERVRAVEGVVRQVMTTETVRKTSLAVRLGSWSMHPVWGLPILLAVLYAMFVVVGQFGAGTLVDFFEETIFGNYVNPWSEKIVKALIPIPILQELIVGEYGLITMAITYAIAIVLPITGAFFIFFGALEDSGYLPRLAIMMDKIFRVMGLNGKAVLPMILGLGCDTMATMTARILDTKKERIIVTLLLALGVPCSAQIGVILGMLAKVSLAGTLIWGGTVIGVMLLVGFLAAKVLPGGESDFLLEIPPLRVPKITNLLVKTLGRIEWYLKEAVPLFILGTFVLFVADKIKLLEVIERVTAPIVVSFMGLPAKAAESFLIGFLRRDYGAAGLFKLAEAGMMDGVQIVVSLITVTLFVPCIANFFMIAKERGVKMAIAMSAFIFPVAFLVGGLANGILRGFGVTL